MRKEITFERESEFPQSTEQREHIWASGYDDCARAMALSMQHHFEFDADTLVRMALGKERERSLNLRLIRSEEFSDLKYEVVSGQKRIELKGEDGQKLITGRCEGEFEFTRDGNRMQVPYEIKDWYPPVVDRLNSFADLVTFSKWTRKGAYQFAAYLWGAEREIGVFLLNRKGMPKALWTTYEECLPLADEFLEKAQHAQDAIILETLPPFPTDLRLCDNCWHRDKHCFPPTIVKPGNVEFDEEWLWAISRYADLERDKREANRLWSRIRDKYRGRELTYAGKYALVGKYGKPGTAVDYDAIPAAVKAKLDDLQNQVGLILEQYQKPGEPRFTLTLERVSPGEGDDRTEDTT
jgi:hypothetical protein